MKIPFTCIIPLIVLWLLIGCSPKKDLTPSGPVPIADFTWADLEGGTIQFTNKTTNADSYTWVFGANNFSTETNPTFKYSTTGAFGVILKAKNQYGESNITRTIPISTLSLSLKKAIDDPKLVKLLPGWWGSGFLSEGANREIKSNYIYRFDENYNNIRAEYISDKGETIGAGEEVRSGNSTVSFFPYVIKNNLIYYDKGKNDLEQFARIEIISDDQIRLFRIRKNNGAYIEANPIILTSANYIEKPMSEAVKPTGLAAKLKGIWDNSGKVYMDGKALDFQLNFSYDLNYFRPYYYDNGKIFLLGNINSKFKITTNGE